jgi:hypothetical protein
MTVESPSPASPQKKTLPPSAWHEGELALQRQAGVEELMDAVGRQVVRPSLGPQHRRFFDQLSTLAAASVDPEGDTWATLLCGAPGFLSTPDPMSLQIGAMMPEDDPAGSGLRERCAVGLLGIDLLTRRRSRLNGHVLEKKENRICVGVAQSYGNCPQYIHSRSSSLVRDPLAPFASPPLWTGDRLDEACRAFVRSADTAFVASYVEGRDGKRDVDVSHKAGKRGFVHVTEDGTLEIPDYPGNQYFNTLGNILVNPRCGIMFPDFGTGDMLQLTGFGQVSLDVPGIARHYGAERLLRFAPRRVVLRRDALPMRWTYVAPGISRG